jgi:hypothetical protein
MSLEGKCYLFESTVYIFTGEGMGKTKKASIRIGNSQVHNKLATSHKKSEVLPLHLQAMFMIKLKT